jgi:hypothetical protein
MSHIEESPLWVFDFLRSASGLCLIELSCVSLECLELGSSLAYQIEVGTQFIEALIGGQCLNLYFACALGLRFVEHLAQFFAERRSACWDRGLRLGSGRWPSGAYCTWKGWIEKWFWHVRSLQ